MIQLAHPFGNWLPDQQSWTDPHMRDAKNVVPDARGFEPFRALAGTTDALPARVLNAFAARDKDGGARIYCGTASNLYEQTSSSAWTSRQSGYAATDSSRWRFAAYKDLILATDYIDPIQVATMSAGSAFANLGGTPPQARFISPFGEFVFTANTTTSAMQVRWSAISNAASWTIGTDQADAVTFPDGGLIRGLGYADVMYVFQEQAIRRIVYVGPPTIMNIDVIERGRGPVTENSIAQLGSAFFYLAEDGFYLFNGQSSQPIGHGKIDEWFANDHNAGFLNRMSSAVDPLNKVVAWLYTSNDSSGGQPDTLLLYNWAADRWAYARQNANVIFTAMAKGLTLDTMDSLYPDLDAITVSLDDPIWLGGALTFAGFTTGHAMGVFRGATLEATLETSDIASAQRLLVREATPLSDTPASTIVIGARERTGDAYSYKSAATQQASGRVPIRASGRQFRARVVIPAGTTWTHAQGLTLIGEAQGVR